jgi:hypothetical protein
VVACGVLAVGTHAHAWLTTGHSWLTLIQGESVWACAVGVDRCVVTAGILTMRSHTHARLTHARLTRARLAEPTVIRNLADLVDVSVVTDGVATDASGKCDSCCSCEKHRAALTRCGGSGGERSLGSLCDRLVVLSHRGFLSLVGHKVRQDYLAFSASLFGVCQAF